MFRDPNIARLSLSQRGAIAHVRDRVRECEASARARVVDSLRRAHCDVAAYEDARECIRDHARVIVHFHPDRLDVTQRSVAEALLAGGIYRNQFETGLSTGGLLPFAGSARDSWERSLFGGAYHADGVAVSERPKYGALELVRFSDGPIPRFGCCYFVLRPHVLRRTSFTFGGSEDPRAPERLGDIDHLDAVMAALFAEIEAGGFASPLWPPHRARTLGVPHLTIPRLLDLVRTLATPRRDPAALPVGRVLDSQIEAQLHGAITLGDDVEMLVADPAFERTATGAVLRQLAEKHAFPLRWHRGFRLAAAAVPAGFRGPRIPPLAQRIAGSTGIVDAATIGAAEATLHRTPDIWRDWGMHADVLQDLKYLWHVLVHYG